MTGRRPDGSTVTIQLGPWQITLRIGLVVAVGVAIWQLSRWAQNTDTAVANQVRILARIEALDGGVNDIKVGMGQIVTRQEAAMSERGDLRARIGKVESLLFGAVRGAASP